MQILSGTLNNLIAMVIILLALSLVVQAIQSAIKKFFRLKSRQIEKSLQHLFDIALQSNSELSPGNSTSDGTSAASTNDPAKALYDETIKGFTAIGRTSFWSRP